MASIKYLSHCTDLGWQAAEFENGAIAGTIGEHRALEAFRITEIAVDPGDEVGVAAHALVRSLGWSDATPIGQDVGSTGLGLPIEAVKIGLTGRDRDKYQIWYRVHVEDIGFMGWCTDGAVSGTEGGSKQVEALQIMLARKTDNFYPVSDVTESYINLTPPPPPPAPAVDKRKVALDIARSYVGYVTGTSNDSVFGRRYAGPQAGAWCCYSVRSICEDAGVEFPPTGYVPTAMEWAKENGKWTTRIDTSRLQAVLFDWAPRNSIPNHIALVEKATNSGCIALEGNTVGPNGEPIGFWRKTRYNSDILGYINLT